MPDMQLGFLCKETKKLITLSKATTEFCARQITGIPLNDMEMSGSVFCSSAKLERFLSYCLVFETAPHELSNPFRGAWRVTDFRSLRVKKCLINSGPNSNYSFRNENKK